MYESAEDGQWGQRKVIGVLSILGVIHIGLAGWIAMQFAPSLSELTLLESGVQILKEGSFDREILTPPLVKVVAAVPLLVQGIELDWLTLKSESIERGTYHEQFQFSMRTNPNMWSIVRCRLMCLPFSLLGMIYCFFWARDLFGTSSGFVAAALWCFWPGIIGHAGFVSADVPAAALGLMTMHYLRMFVKEPSYLAAAILGVVSGFAVLTKLMMFVCYGIVPLMWFLYLLIFQAGNWGLLRLMNYIVQMLLAFAISLAVVNAGYGFVGSMQPLREYEFQSNVLLSKPVDDHFGYPGKKLGSIIVPVPEAYVKSIDEWIGQISLRQPILSFNEDQVFLTRAWYACTPIAIRIPLPFVALMFLALVWYFKHLHFLVDDSYTTSFLLLVPAIFLLLTMLFTSQFSDISGDFLICVPFLIVWVCSPWFDTGDFPMSQIPRWSGYLLVLGVVVSSLHAYPHSQSFYNVFVEDIQKPHEYLNDPTQDWGDDLLLLRDWWAGHPQTPTVHLAYAGMLNPALLELSNKTVPKDTKPADLAPGWYAISEEYVSNPDSPYHEFSQLTPVTRLGKSILLFEIGPPEEAAESVLQDAVTLR